LRIPKRGFSNARYRKEFALVNVDDLNRFENGSVVTPDDLRRNNLIKGIDVRVKVLGDGKLSRSLTVKAHAFSKNAIDKIHNSGGKTDLISRPGTPAEVQC
jgi:large subunit ribosomal protein L15